MNYDKMRSARKKSHKTQDQLAELLGVNRATISKYETGIIDPPVSQVKKISEILNIPISDLLGLESENDSEYDKKLLENLLIEYALNNGDKNSSIFNKLWYFDENGLRFQDGQCIDKLVSLFDLLNTAGQEKAVERLEELTQIPKYKKEQ